ncbi:MAG: hypothetical protein LBU36_05905 [Clostridiales bacterium]|nr:hypothetical protein [Clostridiales bacterium]
MTGAERKIGGKKGVFSAGQPGRPASKRSLREGISAEKTPILSRFSRTSAVHDFENCYKTLLKAIAPAGVVW